MIQPLAAAAPPPSSGRRRLPYRITNKPWEMAPLVRRARRLRKFRQIAKDRELVASWQRDIAEFRGERLVEMLAGVGAGHTYTIYYDAEHTRPLAAVVPYHRYEEMLVNHFKEMDDDVAGV